MMRRTSIALFLLVHIGCAYQPSAPTSTSGTHPAPLPASALVRPSIFTLRAFRSIEGLFATLLLEAKDETGRLAADIDATCTTTAGRISPPKLVGQGSVRAVISDTPAMPVTVACSLNNTDLMATTMVDFSAWKIDLFGVGDEMNQYLQWETQAFLQTDAQTNSVPVLRRSIDWGDGHTDILPGTLAVGSSTTTLRHVYAASGEFHARAVAEWADGRAEVRGILTRRCEFPGLPYPNGRCWSTWRQTP